MAEFRIEVSVFGILFFAALIDWRMASVQFASYLRIGLLALLLVILHGSISAQPPTNGLIAFWPFNGNALDASGNGRNGSVWGPTLVDDRFGTTGSAYYFNGVSDSIVIPDNAAFQFKMTDSYTISLWMKSCDTRLTFPPRLIFGHPPGHAGNAGFFYISHLQNPLISRFGMAVNGTLPLLPGGGYYDGLWHHVVITVADTLRVPEANSSRSTQLFIDGQRVVNRSDPGVINGRNNDKVVNDPLRFGSSFGYDSYEGVIDDTRIYNRALTQAEVTRLYTEKGWPSSAPNRAINFDIKAIGDTTICPGDTVQLQITGSYDSRMWVSTTAGLIDVASNNPQASPAQTTTYELQATKQTIGPPCEVLSTEKRKITIVVREPPALQVSPIVVCSKGAKKITASATGGGGGYKWAWSPATGLDDSTLQNPTVTLDENTPNSYSLTVTDANGCSATRTIGVTLVDPPVVEIAQLQAPNDTLRKDTIYFCRGDEVPLVALARGPESRYFYKWDTPAGLNRVDSSHVIASPQNETLYKVSVSDGGGICPEQSALILLIPVDPPQVEAGKNISICPNGTTELGSDLNDSKWVYQWSPAIDLNDSTLAKPKATVSATTWYYLRATDTVAGCTGIDSVLVTLIDSKPRIDIGSINFGLLGGCRVDTTIVIPIANDGTESINLTKIDGLQGELSSGDIPQRIEAGETKSIRIRFSPSSAGSVSGDLVFRFGPCNDSITIPFSGTKGETNVTVDSTTLNFARIPYCGATGRQSRRLIVRNSGAEDATVSPVLYSPLITDGAFNTSSRILPATIKPGDSIVLTVNYNPPGIGTFSRFILIPFTSGSCTDTLKVFLRAEVYRPTITPDPKQIDFGLLNGCTIDREITINLTNPEKEEVQIDAIEVPNDLLVVAEPTSIAGDSATEQLTLRYKPTASGNLTGFVRILFGPCNDTLSIPLDGQKRGITFNLPDTIDFGEICLGDSTLRSLLVLLDSEGTGNGSITSATIVGDFTSDITVGALLRDKRDNNFNITAKPTLAGPVVGELILQLAPCNVEKRVLLRAVATEVNLAAEPLNFGISQIGAARTGLVRYINRAKTPINIDQVVQQGQPDNVFTILSTSPQLPVTLPSGDTLQVTVQYVPIPGESATSFGALLSTPCDTTIVAIAQGKGESGASARIVVGDITAAPGDKVQLELHLEEGASLRGLPITGFTATVAVESSMLVVQDKGQQQTTGNRREIQIVGRYSAGSNLLAQIPSTVLLGRAEKSSLQLTSFQFTGTGVPIVVERVDGLLTITGLCREGGTRLFNPTGTVAIKSVTPNPTSNQIVIGYSIVEPGEYQMQIVDMAGRTVVSLFSGSLVPGTYQLSGKIGRLPTGSYRLLLETPSLRITKEVQVVK